jgi:drug/metabolite transporter (DMT)-like permease
MSTQVAASAAPTSIATSQQSEARRVRALLWIAISAVLFSLGGMFVRSLENNDAWTTVFVRSLSAAVSITAYLAWRTRGNVLGSLRALGWPGFFVSLAFSGSSIGMVLALTETTVAVVLVLFSLAPLFTALAARAMIGEHVPAVTWAAIVATIVGVGVMVLGSSASVTALGVLLSLIAPIAYSVGAVVIRQHATITMVPAMLAACLINVVISLPLADPLAASRHDQVVLFLFGAAQLGVGLAIFATAAPHTPAAQAALVSMLEPVLGPLWVWAFKDEYPGVPAFVGGSIVFIALAIHTVVLSRRQALRG